MEDKEKAAIIENAISHYNNGRLREAIPLFERAIQIATEPMLKGVLFAHAGVCYAAVGGMDEAKIYLEQGVKLAPEQSITHYLRGNWFMQRKDWYAALQEFDEALKYEADSQSLWNNRGGCLLKLGDKDGAEKCLEKAVEFAPTQIDILENLGAMYGNNNKFDKALPYFTKIIRLERQDTSEEARSHLSEMFVYASTCYERLKDSVRARKALVYALKLDTENSLAYYKLGDLLVQDKKFMKAITAYVEALKRDADITIIEKIAIAVDKLPALDGARTLCWQVQSDKMQIDQFIKELESIIKKTEESKK